MTRPSLLIAAALLAVTGMARADEVPDDDAASEDIVAPTLLACYPAHGAKDVPLDVRPSLKFSEEIAAASVNGRTFWIGGPGRTLMPGAINVSGVTATIVPAARLLPGMTYVTAVTSGVRDLEGNGLNRDYACSFTTAGLPPAAAVPEPAPMPSVPVPVKPAAGEVVVKDRRWYVAPIATYSFPVCDECVDSGAGWGAVFGKAISDRWNLELSYLDRELDVETTPGFAGAPTPGVTQERSIGLNGLWFVDRRLRYAPFVLAGAGLHEQDWVGREKASVPYGTVGVGLLVSPWYGGLGFRFGAQWVRPWGDDYCGKGETLAEVGLHVPFGG